MSKCDRCDSVLSNGVCACGYYLVRNAEQEWQLQNSAHTRREAAALFVANRLWDGESPIQVVNIGKNQGHKTRILETFYEVLNPGDLHDGDVISGMASYPVMVSDGDFAGMAELVGGLHAS